MVRFGGWLGGKAASATPRAGSRLSTQSLTALEEPQHLQEALRASVHIMSDDVETAEAQLAQGNSAFHKIGSGTISFLRAALGFEHEIMREATERLYDAESSAYERHRKLQRQPNATISEIFPAGTEYAVIQAQAQIMGAVLGVLTESFTEALKGFYKVRKASGTLHGIMQTEEKYISSRSPRPSSSGTSSEPMSPTSPAYGSPRSYAHDVAAARRPSGSLLADQLYSSIRGSMVLRKPTEFEDEGLEFHDAKDMGPGPTDNYLGHVESHTLSLQDESDFSDSSQDAPSLTDDKSASTSRRGSTSGTQSDSVFSGNPVDEFIHSGANLHYGILQMILSLIPPAFSKILSVIGFHGDREKGLEMLWQATDFKNIHSALAGLLLLSYYNGLMMFMDILPPRSNAYPRERLAAMLAEMRAAFPKSGLWLAEEARAMCANRRLADAVALVKDTEESPMKEVEALARFDYSLNTLYLGAWEESAKASLRCVALNNWTHALYYYNAASAHIELYREAKYVTKDAEAAELHARKAEELIDNVPIDTAKKRLLGRPMPFEWYVGRKLSKWRARSEQWDCALVDAVGVSPACEMTMFWGGFARMTDQQLRASLARLAWSDGGCPETDDLLQGDELCYPAIGKNINKDRESVDEAGSVAVMRAAVLRQLGHTSRAKRLLQPIVDRSAAGGTGKKANQSSDEYKSNHSENWVPAIARYELGTCYWAESEEGQASEGERRGMTIEEVRARGERDPSDDNNETLRQACYWIERSAAWETYDLDNRMGMKVATARQTLRKLGYSNIGI